MLLRSISSKQNEPLFGAAYNKGSKFRAVQSLNLRNNTLISQPYRNSPLCVYEFFRNNTDYVQELFPSIIIYFINGSFNDAVNSWDYTASNGRINECWMERIWKEILEPMLRYNPKLTWSNWGKLSVGIVGFRVKIRTRHLLNTSQKCYR
jgi:hypothetical protein